MRQAEAITLAAAICAPNVQGMSVGKADSSQASSASRSGATNQFYIANQIAEPTSETARKASACICRHQ